MSDTVLVALISGGVTLIGTMITVFANALKTRKESNNRLDKIESKLDGHIKADERESATQCRSRILRFCNDVRRGLEFTKDFWDTIMIDITFYSTYTAKNPDFKNQVCVHAVEYLENKYDELLETNGFAV